MTRRAGHPARPKRNWEALAWQALQRNDLAGARVALSEAVAESPRHLQLRHSLATVLQEFGEIDDAAHHLSVALRFHPEAHDVARQLSRLLSRFTVSQPGRLDPYGLKAALAFDTVERQPLCDAVFAYLRASEPELDAAIGAAAAGNTREAAQTLLAPRNAGLLRNDLLLAALAAEVITDPDLERLLTAMRRSLVLDGGARRLEDRALFAFALALAAQLANNEYVWEETGEERAALDGLEVDRDALLAGDIDAARRLLLNALFEAPEDLLAVPDAAACRAIRPKPLRDFVCARIEKAAELRSAVGTLARLSAPADAVSRLVASQYEEHPYPRWASVHVSPAGSLRVAMESYFERDRLAFMDEPFDVLIAGAGTGRQALQSYFAYGPKVRLLGIDLSAASLAYAQTAARRYGAQGAEFAVADILDLSRLERTFDIIECVGVLHHMADPWAGWRKLLEKLAPRGLMYIGLYSAASRANIRALRAEPLHPGPGCDDRTARAYRAALLARPEGELGSELRRSQNFYTLKEFRDLVLHENEHHVTLDQIGAFLEENGLRFYGFTLDRTVVDDFASRYPDDAWPGKLENWAGYEKDNPRTFDGMYRFWCARD
jgi:SAM-dependent methyltransferase